MNTTAVRARLTRVYKGFTMVASAGIALAVLLPRGPAGDILDDSLMAGSVIFLLFMLGFDAWLKR